MLDQTNNGCAVKPVSASVTAKQASMMLALLWSLGLLFTAAITNTFSIKVKGQVVPLIIMLGIIQKIVAWTCVSPLSVNGFDAFSEVILVNLEFTIVVEKKGNTERYR